MAKVVFYTATSAQYNALATKDESALYFISDTGEIFKGNSRCSFPIKTIEDFPESGEKGILYVKLSTHEIKLWDGTVWHEAVGGVVTDLCGAVTNNQIPSALAARNYVELLADHTAWAVFPHDFVIPAGSIAEMETVIRNKLAVVYGDWVLTQELAEALPVQMTYMFNIATTCSDMTKSDVIVDWGDGSRSVVRNGDYVRVVVQDELTGSKNIVMSHTYSTSQKYVVRIFGNDYFGFRSQIDPEKSGVEEDYKGKFNLICECLSKDLPVARHLTNGASMFIYSDRLLKIDGSYCYPLRNITNCSAMFSTCNNLISVKNIMPHDSASTCIMNMFQNCKNLRETNLTLPPLFSGTAYGLRNVFYKCSKMQADIANFFTDYFVPGSISIIRTFAYCTGLTGTVPANYLWGDRRINWILNISNDSAGSNKNGMFYGCSDAIRAQVPLAWGGTAAEIQPAKSLSEAIEELEVSVSWAELNQ